MSIVVISDTHLTKKFSQKKFDKLKSIISGSDQVVLNGDFWDGYQTDFDSFYNSKWSALFPILKSKKTIYIFGNHDKKEFSDERIQNFCDVATSEFTVQTEKYKFRFEHGHERVWKVDRKLGLNRPPKWLSIGSDKAQSILLRSFGLKAYCWMFGKMNAALKKSVRKSGHHSPDTFHFFGHVHIAELDLKNNFVNTGVFNHGHAQYAVVEADGKIKAFKERY